jgi:ABC-2 type transport system permease protein
MMKAGEPLKQLIDILWYKLAMWKASASSPSDRLPLKKIFSIIVYAAFAVGAVLFARFVTWYLLEYVRIGLFLFHRLIAIVLFVFFTTVSAGNIVVSFATLYRSPEMNFLLSMPVPYSTVFTVKFLDNFFYSSGTLFLASFAVLLGYGMYFHLHWYFYPVYMLGVLVPCMLMAGSLAVILLVLVMKLAAKVPFKVLIGCVAAAYVLQVVAYFTVTSPIALVKDVMQYYPFVNAYYGAVDPPVTRFLPNYWAAQALYFWITDFTPGLLSHIALCVLSSLACFIAAVLLGGRYFYETWLTSLSIRPAGDRKRTTEPPFFHFERESRLSPHAEAILKKEYWQFFREPSQWIHASVLGALLLIFLASVGTMQFTVVTSDLRAVIYLVVFVFNAFLLSSIALRFAFPVMSLEGRAYWTVRSSPVSPSKVYWIKCGTIAALLAVLGTIIWFVSTIPYTAVPFMRASSFAIITAVALAAASLNAGMGSVYADFGEKNPIRIASSQGATMTFLFTMAMLVVVVALYFFPVVTIFVAHYAGRSVRASTVGAPVAAIAALCAVISAAAHWAGLRALKNDF